MGRDVTVEEIYQWARSFESEISCKRAEENIKFVFKLTLKHLRLDFFSKHNLKPGAQESELIFYKYYFEKLALSWNLPISEFFDPLNFRTNQKTLNNDFLRRLFSASEFRAKFLEYLTSGQLKREYWASVPKKLFKMLKRFERILTSNDSEKLQTAILAVQKYFRTNKQCKVPWTENEVDMAIRYFMQFCGNDS